MNPEDQRRSDIESVDLIVRVLAWVFCILALGLVVGLVWMMMKL